MATFGRQRIADARFVERTGKSMREWTKILDRWGAKEKGHPATARYLIAKSHQRVYVQWITEAKRPETRARRIAETVKKLSAR